MRTLDCVSRRGTGQGWLQDDFRAQRARLLGSVHWLTRMRLIHHPNPASARKAVAYSRSSNNGGHGAFMFNTIDTPPRETHSSVTLVAWRPSRDLDFPEWAAVGRRLGAMGRCCQWTIGDWIRYGHAKFGERYAPAARITGYDVQTLMNMVHVASRFEVSRRRKSLSWSHHETVASLEPDQQEYWLDRAVAERFSVADLRLELRSSRRKRAQVQVSPSGPPIYMQAPKVLVTCPSCGGQFPAPANLGLVAR
jgi:hypothetical protein